MSHEDLREHFTTSKFFFDGQTEWAEKHYWDVWDDLCIAYGTRDGQPGPWFNCTEAIAKVDFPGVKETVAGRIRLVMWLALERVDPDDPAIERKGQKYRFLPPKQ